MDKEKAKKESEETEKFKNLFPNERQNPDLFNDIPVPSKV